MSAQQIVFDGHNSDADRSLLDKLLTDSRLYRSSQQYIELFAFVSRLRNFAPFNALLLHIQKPGLTYAAYASDWKERFGRVPKEDARPLLILRPFGPIALVYDVLDTEGKPLPPDVECFPAKGSMTSADVLAYLELMGKSRISCDWIDAGDGKAGAIRCLKSVKEPEPLRWYGMKINKNHPPATQFVTIAHELAHLFLGHLGQDKKLSIPDRCGGDLSKREIEAESVAYLVCNRNGVEPRSHTYLANHVDKSNTVDSIDLYQIMRAAGQVEGLLKLSSHTRFTRPVL